MAHVSLAGVCKDYGGRRILKDIDLEIETGEFVVFVGPSGQGKSSLLRIIAGLEDLTAGTLTIGGRIVNDLPPKDRRVAMVFQNYAIFPHMTVRENIAFGLTIAGASRAEKEAKVAEAARILRMERLLDRSPSQLSGGQRQRVAIGRALVRKPDIFLFDEPLSNLDAALRVEMRLEIARLHHELGAVMLYVTHDQVEAMTLADRIVVLNEGAIQQVGAPLDLYHRPANRFVAGFIGAPRMNFITARLASVDGGPRLQSVALGEIILDGGGQDLRIDEEFTVGLRPHHFTLDDGGVGTTVKLVEELGNETNAVVALPSGQRLTVALPASGRVRVGDTLPIRLKPGVGHLFRASGEAVAGR